MRPHGYPHGVVGCFSDDIHFAEWLKFAKRIARLIYYGGRFGADVALPFVALNMARMRRSAEKSSWFLKRHV